jgi:glycosyltransferase involved in cell wall biosynthesis
VTAPIRVVPTGIDLAAFARGHRERARRKLHLAPDTFVVGHVGRLAPEKNLGFLTEAVAQFLTTAPEAVFLVVGSGPSETQIKEACERAGVGDRLILAGKLTGRPLYDAYAAMDVFAFASFSETQGMVLAEAMAARLPVVALDANGVREVVRHEQNGYLLPADAPADVFAQHLARLHAAPKRRTTFSRAATETAQLFSREHCARLALDFYREIRRATRRERLVNELSPWSTLLNRLEVEWNLLASTANAVLEAVRSERETAAP